uniref:Uncharacterized protein n=1 Tax=Oryza rufipogon TaxID=4529 RepID=A0A0E0PRZ3_ORYRU
MPNVQVADVSNLTAGITVYKKDKMNCMLDAYVFNKSFKVDGAVNVFNDEDGPVAHPDEQPPEVRVGLDLGELKIVDVKLEVVGHGGDEAGLAGARWAVEQTKECNINIIISHESLSDLRRRHHHLLDQLLDLWICDMIVDRVVVAGKNPESLWGAVPHVDVHVHPARPHKVGLGTFLPCLPLFQFDATVNVLNNKNGPAGHSD